MSTAATPTPASPTATPNPDDDASKHDAPESPAPRRRRARRLILVLGIVVALVVAASGWLFFNYGAKSAPAALDPNSLSSKVPTDSKALFGGGCGSLPTSASDPASPAAMTGKNVSDIVATNPQLTTLYKAVRKAGLLSAFDNSAGMTMLMPTNAAFDKVPTFQLKFVLSNKSLDTRILNYHVIEKALNPKQLNLNGPFETREGTQLHVRGFGEKLRLGAQDAQVICGNIHARNTTIYLIDTVLIPA